MSVRDSDSTKTIQVGKPGDSTKTKETAKHVMGTDDQPRAVRCVPVGGI